MVVAFLPNEEAQQGKNDRSKALPDLVRQPPQNCHTTSTHYKVLVLVGVQ